MPSVLRDAIVSRLQGPRVTIPFPGQAYLLD
jgi:hypothetical protein